MTESTKLNIRALDRDLINRIVEAEKNPPDISTVDPVVRTRVQGWLDDWKAETGRDDIENSPFHIFIYYWGYELERLRALQAEADAKLRAAGLINPANGGVIREYKPMPFEVALAFGYAVEANPMFWQRILDMRAFDAVEAKAEKDGLVIGLIEDIDPDYGIPNFRVNRGLYGSYTGYFAWKHAPQSEKESLRCATVVMMKRGKVSEIGERKFFEELLKLDGANLA